jgi:hypothetical protein
MRYTVHTPDLISQFSGQFGPSVDLAHVVK